jgi:hypothetical protein
VCPQRRSAEAKIASLARSFTDTVKLVTATEVLRGCAHCHHCLWSQATLISLLTHVQSICERTSNVADYVEALIEQQLVAAIGKVSGSVCVCACVSACVCVCACDHTVRTGALSRRL